MEKFKPEEEKKAFVIRIVPPDPYILRPNSFDPLRPDFGSLEEALSNVILSHTDKKRQNVQGELQITAGRREKTGEYQVTVELPNRADNAEVRVVLQTMVSVRLVPLVR